jgi:dCMP deaminase
MSMFSRCFHFLPVPDIHPEDLRFCVNVARLLAARSRANRLRVGAVLWHPKRRSIISQGYNGTPAGTSNVMEAGNITLDTVVHAERNVFQKCHVWEGVGGIMVVTHSPCRTCAEQIRDRGVRKVYYLENYRDHAGVTLLRDAGIMVQRVLM